MSQKILVTGPTGNVGREVIARLQQLDAPLRAAVISEQEAQRLPAGVTDWRLFDFGDPSTYAAAFEDVDRLFLMRPPQISDIKRYIKPVIDYASEIGIKQIVFLSLLGAEKNRIVPHAKVETFLLASGVPYTLLRCGFFMQNLSTTHRQDIAEHNDIFVSAGKGKTSFIDVRDIAAVAAKTLTEPGHENKAYPLTGKVALSYYEVADIFSEVLDRPIRYSNPSPIRFAWRMHKQGHPWGFVGVISGIYLTTRFGLAQTITPVVNELLGRDPIAMQDFVRDNAAVWATKTSA